MDNKLVAVLSFGAGVFVGMNWPKISKDLKKYATQFEKMTGKMGSHGLKFFEEQKEYWEDMGAEAKAKKSKKAKAAKFAESEFVAPDEHEFASSRHVIKKTRKKKAKKSNEEMKGTSAVSEPVKNTENSSEKKISGAPDASPSA